MVQKSMNKKGTNDSINSSNLGDDNNNNDDDDDIFNEETGSDVENLNTESRKKVKTMNIGMYQEEIDKLRKENFDLKMRIYTNNINEHKVPEKNKCNLAKTLSKQCRRFDKITKMYKKSLSKIELINNRLDDIEIRSKISGRYQMQLCSSELELDYPSSDNSNGVSPHNFFPKYCTSKRESKKDSEKLYKRRIQSQECVYKKNYATGYAKCSKQNLVHTAQKGKCHPLDFTKSHNKAVEEFCQMNNGKKLPHKNGDIQLRKIPLLRNLKYPMNMATWNIDKLHDGFDCEACESDLPPINYKYTNDERRLEENSFVRRNNCDILTGNENIVVSNNIHMLHTENDSNAQNPRKSVRFDLPYDKKNHVEFVEQPLNFQISQAEMNKQNKAKLFNEVDLGGKERNIIIHSCSEENKSIGEDNSEDSGSKKCSKIELNNNHINSSILCYQNQEKSKIGGYKLLNVPQTECSIEVKENNSQLLKHENETNGQNSNRDKWTNNKYLVTDVNKMNHCLNNEISEKLMGNIPSSRESRTLEIVPIFNSNKNNKMLDESSRNIHISKESRNMEIMPTPNPTENNEISDKIIGNIQSSRESRNAEIVLTPNPTGNNEISDKIMGNSLGRREFGFSRMAPITKSIGKNEILTESQIKVNQRDARERVHVASLTTSNYEQRSSIKNELTNLDGSIEFELSNNNIDFVKQTNVKRNMHYEKPKGNTFNSIEGHIITTQEEKCYNKLQKNCNHKDVSYCCSDAYLQKENPLIDVISQTYCSRINDKLQKENNENVSNQDEEHFNHINMEIIKKNEDERKFKKSKLNIFGWFSKIRRKFKRVKDKSILI